MKIFLGIFFFSILLLTGADAHPSKKHKPIVCIPEEQRTPSQLQSQKVANFFHRLSKLQQDCAIIKLEKQKEAAICPKVSFGHRASRKTNLHLEANDKSKVSSVIEKNQEMLFISEANKKWNYVTIKAQDKCIDGYIRAKYTVTKGDKDTVVSVGPKLLSIIQPDWKIENKLITINAEGTVSIVGAVEEGKVDQVLINGEDESIQSNNTFSHLLFVSSDGAEVRIVASNKGKKVKELIFKVQVGN